ncbi:hypothetical protein [Aquimonas sp.]|uniref:hypothetical protein n=1 Tax=Aquimonas sp. TaxID=1872588 RepID=UPI0037BE7284
MKLAHHPDAHLSRVFAALVCVLTVAVALPFLFGMAVTDTARDFTNATVIALGHPLPLLGPSINGTWALGPAWFFVLALPLFVSAQFVLLPLTMSLIAALKVPLAASLGRQLAGNAGGLALAALIAFPGWWWVGALTPTHASVTETAVLACLLLALPVRRERRPLSAGRGFAAGLCFSLALHAHPTAVVLAPLLGYLLWPQRRAWRGVLAAVGGGVLPVLPVAWKVLQGRTTQVDASLRYFADGDYGQRLREIPTDIAGLLLRGETYADSLLLQTSQPLPVFASAALLLLGLAARPRRRCPACRAVAVSVAGDRGDQPAQKLGDAMDDLRPAAGTGPGQTGRAVADRARAAHADRSAGVRGQPERAGRAWRGDVQGSQQRPVGRTDQPACRSVATRPKPDRRAFLPALDGPRQTGPAALPARAGDLAAAR